MLRCTELGLHPSDLAVLEYGAVVDMLIERGNDKEEYDYKATQADFDKF